jgi:NADH-quinone oxidoreductase subunit N
LYAIVGYLNPSRRSQEGAIKYFVLGSFAAALLLFGFGLLYVATGSLRLTEISQVLPKISDHPWVKVGVLFIVSGLGFKLALAPFHLWAPDTYEAAPTGVTALMATTVKAMIIIVTLRFFAGSLAQVYVVWLPAIMFLATVSMILGNIMALVQSSLKRMLAYSSIAHSGYMAIAICALGGSGGSFTVAAVLYYLVGYTIISLGAFSVLMWLESANNDNLMLDDITGLAKKHPWAAFALATFMFSFAGMPPTVGFIGKFFVFNAALNNQLYSLVVVGVVGSSISLFYYLRVIVRMYMAEPVKVAEPLAPSRSRIVTAILAVALIANLALGTALPEFVMKNMVTTSKEIVSLAKPISKNALLGH